MEKKNVQKVNEVNAREAIYGFMAWLTGRSEVTTLSKIHDASAVPFLIEMFCNENNFPEVTKNYPKNIIIPQ
jgi:hypothetical protein